LWTALWLSFQPQAFSSCWWRRVWTVGMVRQQVLTWIHISHVHSFPDSSILRSTPLLIDGHQPWLLNADIIINVVVVVVVVVVDHSLFTLPLLYMEMCMLCSHVCYVNGV
jgi:hypothetical protein